MQVVDNHNPVFFDVDDTLILSSKVQPALPGLIGVTVIDPITQNQLFYRRNSPMIRLLEEEVAKGSFVVVWSRGGYEWAKAVVEALKLQDKVNMIMSKPMVYFDDKDVSEWLTYRVYIAPDVRYKNN